MLQIRLLVALVVLPLLPLAAVGLPQPPVKQSRSRICHDQSSLWYGRTTHFKAYPTLRACLGDGGRLPKGNNTPAVRPDPVGGNDYDRDRQFGSWIDEDGDCLNTRHELLAELSTTAARRDGCRVIHGRWNDPYTGRVFTESRDMDIDHMVPLKWAWEHGADRWSRNRRVSFANDPRNLFAVAASTNREKGASGPLDWLPPNTAYRCQYVLRFMRIVKNYSLGLSKAEAANLSELQGQLCG